MTFYKPVIMIAVILSTILIMLSCGVTKKDKGWEYFPDMAYTGDHPDAAVYEAYDPNSVFKDGKTSRKPVKGTIPRGYKPHHFPDRGLVSIKLKNGKYSMNFATMDDKKKKEDAEKAGKELKNPVALNARVLERGKRLYLRNCAVCHGVQGKGKGKVQVGASDLTSDKIKNYPSGRLYYVITKGNLTMPSYASQVSTNDRWKIVHYLEKEIIK
ncbi:MAG: cytochrome c [bacterium]|nr:MAG: cytochrome c [bacterium]